MDRPPATTAPSPAERLAELLAWAKRRPFDAILGAAILAVLVYFFGCYHVFTNGLQTVAQWASKAWNPENDLEYGPFIFPGAIFIAWWHREALAQAPKSSSPLGLVITIFGVLMFVFSVRTLQPRFAIFSLPVLIYGSVRYLWGAPTARVIVFPCVFLLFMVPLGFLVSRTVGLQTLAATIAAKLSALLGIHVEADGDSLRALDGSFQFEVAGGCSGIRSLTAMTMLAALYVHFTQEEFWKKVVIFCCSLFFALIGNFMRIFTVVLFAHFISPKIAAGLYHDWSGFIFFPIAVGAMVLCSELLNRDWSHLLAPTPAPGTAPAGASTSKPGAPREKAASPISYDY